MVELELFLNLKQTTNMNHWDNSTKGSLSLHDINDFKREPFFIMHFKKTYNKMCCQMKNESYRRNSSMQMVNGKWVNGDNFKCKCNVMKWWNLEIWVRYIWYRGYRIKPSIFKQNIVYGSWIFWKYLMIWWKRKKLTVFA